MKQYLLAAAASAGPLIPVATADAARHYSNCTQLRGDYPHGVGLRHARDHVRGSTAPVTNFKRSNRLYWANSGLDRDGDHVACEEH